MLSAYLSEILEKYNYPESAQNVVLESYVRLKEIPAFQTLLGDFYPAELTLSDVLSSLQTISEDSGINQYTLNLVFYLCLTPALRKEYEKNRIDESVYYDTVEDLLYKLNECFDIEGVWGVTPADWYYSLFHLKSFALGRLEYALGVYDGEDTDIAGRNVQRGDKAVYIHIPSSRKPFDKEARIKSYEKAYYFYKENFAGGEPLFVCNSWLLNPPNRDILGAKSNIVSFMDDFKIVSSYTYPDKRNLWRIFGKSAELAPDKFSRETSMQRAFADWLEQGNALGAGVGLFYFDPRKRETVK